MRVVDQTLPANGRAGLFEVDAHDDLEIAGEAAALFRQPFGIFHGGNGIMDGAGADDDDQSVVFAPRI